MEQELLFGKYRILELLANGGGGEVFLAEHRVLGERRIIKRLLKSRPFYEERKKEAHTLKQLHHVSIPRIYDIEEDDTACYIIEEDMGGETLSDFLFRQKCLPTSLISHYSIQLCDIIEYLHQHGILYLDVKPENIIVRDDTLALIDFGGALQNANRGSMVFGTQGYAAPEQQNGFPEERSDVYGIGCVLGVLLGGETKGRKALVQIYEKCVRSVPARRYPSVSALKAELQRVYFGERRKRRRNMRFVPKYIGVIDIHEGAEGGAFCTLLASHLNDREKGRVVCIDLSGCYLFGQLYESLFGKYKKIPDSFMLQGVCYVTEGDASDIGKYVARGYSAIVLYLGVGNEALFDEFLRCDSRFALGALFPWRLSAWQAFSERLNDKKIHRSVTAVITGGEKEMLPIRYERVIGLPYVEDVFRGNRQTEKLLCSLFRQEAIR